MRRAVRASFRHPPVLERGSRVLVACSGGADSMALAAAVAFEAPPAGLLAGAVTVDHGLQDGSGERAERVATSLRTLGLDPVEVVRVDVTGTGGPEAAARGARYAALDERARRHGAAAVLLGHSLDDQAETVLLGLVRGSGARSLAGMPPVRGLLRRPLLDLDRATLRAACRAEALEPWDDPHNADPAYTRARVRGSVLPVLERELGPGVAAALARTARLLRADADALDELAAAAAAGVRTAEGDLDVAALEALPAAVRTRVLRSAAIAAGCPPTALAEGHVRAVDELVTAWRGQREVQLPGQVRARRAYGRLSLGIVPTHHRP